VAELKIHSGGAENARSACYTTAPPSLFLPSSSEEGPKNGRWGRGPRWVRQEGELEVSAGVRHGGRRQLGMHR
jgi:hypothetical protein